MKKSISKIGFTLLLCLSILSSLYIQNIQTLNASSTNIEFEEISPRGDQLIKYIDFTDKVVKSISEVVTKE